MIRGVGEAIRRVLVVGLASVLVFALGCEDERPGEAADRSIPAAQQPEETADEASPFSLEEANSEFALGLYRELRTEDGNLFFSPYSVSAALAMTLAGARGETAAQMAEVLHFDANEQQVHESLRLLDETLAGRGTLPAGAEGEGFDLHVVNAVWPQLGCELLDTFLGTVTDAYGAGLQELDYATDPDGARRTINDWVSRQTAEKILNLIPEGAIDRATRLVLTNAIYFNAPWLHPFDPKDTAVETFALLDGGTTDVDMMHLTESLPFAQWEDGVAFELPYNGSDLATLFLVPNLSTFETFDATLSLDVLEAIAGSLQPERIALGLPRFEFEYAASLVPALRRLGMVDAFDGNLADFSGITGDRDLMISDVLHKAFVSVDEAGTEAAAATAVLFRATGIPAEPTVLTVDRPFIFVIRDRPTGSILFVGRVVSP